MSTIPEDLPSLTRTQILTPLVIKLCLEAEHRGFARETLVDIVATQLQFHDAVIRRESFKSILSMGKRHPNVDLNTIVSKLLLDTYSEVSTLNRRIINMVELLKEEPEQ